MQAVPDPTAKPALAYPLCPHLHIRRAAVISVPHFEWPRLQKHRLDLLHRKLAQAGLEPAHFLAERKGHGNGGGGKEGKK